MVGGDNVFGYRVCRFYIVMVFMKVEFVSIILGVLYVFVFEEVIWFVKVVSNDVIFLDVFDGVLIDKFVWCWCGKVGGVVFVSWS